MDIIYGSRIITGVDSQRQAWEDLANAPTNHFLLSVIESQCPEVMQEIRNALEVGNLGKAQELNGYLKALEDTIDFLGKNVSESLSDK